MWERKDDQSSKNTEEGRFVAYQVLSIKFLKAEYLFLSPLKSHFKPTFLYFL